MNDFKKTVTDFHYGKFSLLFSCLFFVPSLGYNFVINTKNFLYSIGILKEQKINARVICVGNLTTGGVGKTPVVVELANYLANKGEKVCILSRGYGGKLGKKEPSLIRNYDEILINNVSLTGDEVNLISQNVKCPVVISKNRLEGAKFASANLKCSTIIMDDGFSNRKLFKDLNILLFDTKKLTGNGLCLPMGPLREPVSEIKRAQKVLFINKNNEESGKLDKFIEKLKIPYSTCFMNDDKIYNIESGKEIGDIKNIIAFSAIGSPEQFYKKLGAFNLKETISLNDHFEYNQETIDKINSIAKKNEADAIITTEKDAVKIKNLKGVENIYALKLKPVLDFDFLLD